MLLGDQADVLLVAARTDDGVGLFEVDPARVIRTHTPAMDTTLRLATLRLDGCPGTPVAAGPAAPPPRWRGPTSSARWRWPPSRSGARSGPST